MREFLNKNSFQISSKDSHVAGNERPSRSGEGANYSCEPQRARRGEAVASGWDQGAVGRAAGARRGGYLCTESPDNTSARCATLALALP